MCQSLEPPLPLSIIFPDFFSIIKKIKNYVSLLKCADIMVIKEIKTAFSVAVIASIMQRERRAIYTFNNPNIDNTIFLCVCDATHERQFTSR